MRTILSGSTLCCIFLVCLFSACTKAVDDVIGGSENNAYTVSEIDFFLSADDSVDSVFSRLDTITVVNNTSNTLPDTTLYPYQSLKDSVYITLDHPLPDTLLLTDTVSFRHRVVRPGADGEHVLSELPTDSVSISGFPAIVSMPLLQVHIAETFRPTPKTRYDITGEYWRVWYSVSFRAYAVRPGDGQTIVLHGKVRYSTVSVSSNGGQDPRPKSVITIISDIE